MLEDCSKFQDHTKIENIKNVLNYFYSTFLLFDNVWLVKVCVFFCFFLQPCSLHVLVSFPLSVLSQQLMETDESMENQKCARIIIIRSS